MHLSWPQRLLDDSSIARPCPPPGQRRHLLPFPDPDMLARRLSGRLPRTKDASHQMKGQSSRRVRLIRIDNHTYSAGSPLRGVMLFPAMILRLPDRRSCSRAFARMPSLASRLSPPFLSILTSLSLSFSLPSLPLG